MKRHAIATVAILVTVLIVLTVIAQLLQSGCGCGNSIIRTFSGRCFPSSGDWHAQAFAVAFLFLWINFRRSVRKCFAPAESGTAREIHYRKAHQIEIAGAPVSLRAAVRTAPLPAAVLAALFASAYYSQWDTYLRFRYGGSCGFSDPIFGIDGGFYLFRLPFYEFLQSSLVILTVLALIGAVCPRIYAEVTQLKAGRRLENLGMRRSAAWHPALHPCG